MAAKKSTATKAGSEAATKPAATSSAKTNGGDGDNDRFRWSVENERKLLLLCARFDLGTTDFKEIAKGMPATNEQGIRQRYIKLRIEAQKVIDDNDIKLSGSTGAAGSAAGKKRGADKTGNGDEAEKPVKKSKANTKKTKAKDKDEVEAAVNSGGEDKNEVEAAVNSGNEEKKAAKKPKGRPKGKANGKANGKKINEAQDVINNEDKDKKPVKKARGKAKKTEEEPEVDDGLNSEDAPHDVED